MGRNIKTALLTGLILAATAAPAWAETRINCPLQQARRTITDKLPNGWWTTPIVDRLSQTKVMTIGGKPALMCIYGKAGAIQRNAPAGRRCKAITGGFSCSGGVQAPAPTVTAPLQPTQPTTKPAKPVTFSTGGLTVPQTHLFDVDRGAVGQQSTADIWFQAKTPRDLYLTPRNGAAMSVSGSRNRGLAGCRTAKYSKRALPLRKVRVGTYICVKTNEGRIADFRINALSGGVPKTLKLGYTSWQ